MAAIRRAGNPAAKSMHAGVLDERISRGLSVVRALPAERRIYSPRQEVYAEGEHNANVYFVLDGWAVLYKILEDGRRQILDFALPGAILGFGTVGTSRHTAESLTNLTVAVLPCDRVDEIIARDTSFAVWFVETLAGNLASAYESLTDAGCRTSREAVAHLLLRLARRKLAGRPCPEGTVLELPVKLEHLGDAIGLTAVHVCRILRGLREDGVVTHHKGHLRIHSPSHLVAAAGILADDVRASNWLAA